MKKVGILMAGALAVVALGVGQAEAKDYVIESSRWGQAEQDAVTAAGGTVRYSHAGAGLAVVSSDAPDFAALAQASGQFRTVTEDFEVRWQPETTNVEFEEAAIDPLNDTFYPLQWAPIAVEASGAWAAGCEGAGVRVAIVDGGLFNAHPDLAANVDTARSASFVAGQPYNNDTGTFWHATHVAGIVAAIDNSIGVVGIAPKATIIGVKVLHAGSGSFGAVIAGILYSATPIADGGAGADIINMSLGAVFPRGGGNTGAGPLVAAMSKAVNYADRYGVLVVSAAGNSALDMDHTGSLIEVPGMSGSGLAVSATGPEGWALGATNFRRQASYTNFGNSIINVAAPGGDFTLPGDANCTMPIVGGTITRPCWVFDLVLSTSRGSTLSGGYSWAAGTSMASPAASAVAALIKGKNPGVSLGALKNALANSADDEGDNGHDPIYGRGFVNARRACTE